MDFDEAAQRAGRAARAAASGLPRPSMTEVRGARRRRTGIGALSAAFIGTVAALGAAMLWPEPAPRVPVATAPITTTTTASTTTTTTTVPAPSSRPALWSILYPSTWHRADSELMPNLSWRSMTLATFPIVAGGNLCAHIPENSLRALGADDALISIFFSRTVAGDARPWPEEGFDDAVFPAADEPVDAHECAERRELEVHWGPWRHGVEGLYVLVAFGSDVTDAVRDETWSVLSSLVVPETRDPAPPCVATRPPQPGLTVPAAYPETPTVGVWYGTADLWTVLEPDGSYGYRKSVWWSANFPGGFEEEQPEISTTWERLDADAEPHTDGPPGTNAYTPEDGWFMIAGIDPDTPGCWRVTARYKGAVLSYVYHQS